jgi:predicted SAM-dependent methyltransferase
MYKHLANQACNEAITGEVLSISGSQYLSSLIAPNGKIIEADYPEYSILDLAFEENRFELLVSDQVLEHIEGNPFQAIEESHRVLKPGGIAIHTTVLLYQIHCYPGDFWRFTPDGLKVMCRRFSRIIDASGWGNRYVWGVSWLGLLSETVPEASWHPYNKIANVNEENYPVVTWIVAQK